MNEKTILDRLQEKHGIPPGNVSWFWHGTAGPAIHISGANVCGLLPIADDQDVEFADFIGKLANEEFLRQIQERRVIDETTEEVCSV